MPSRRHLLLGLSVLSAVLVALSVLAFHHAHAKSHFDGRATTGTIQSVTYAGRSTADYFVVYGNAGANLTGDAHRYAKGDRVAVSYDPAHPYRAHVAGLKLDADSNYGGAILLGLAALGTLYLARRVR